MPLSASELFGQLRREPDVEAPESIVLRPEPQLDASGLPLGTASN